MWNISIRPIDMIVFGSNTPGESEPGSNGSEGILCIP